MPAVPSERNDDEKDGIDFRPNGGIHLWFDGKRVKLRPARLRDYKKLVGAWREATDELRILADTATTWSGELQAAIETREDQKPTPDERAEDVKRGREIDDRTEELALEWWALVVETLGPEDADVMSDPAAWMGNAAVINETIGHWRTVPSLSGVQ